MNKRAFINLLGGATIWPVVAHGQQAEGTRRVGVLLPATTDDSEYPSLVNAFVGALARLGWTESPKLRIDIRWASGKADSIRAQARELVGLAPDVIVAPGASTAGPLLQATQTIPIVFTIVPDPVGAGFVGSLAHPGGNATGFTSFEYDIGGKWLEILKELAPRVTRVAVIRDAAITAGIGQWSAIQTAAPASRLEVTPINLRGAPELERDLAAFARSGNGGLIVTSSGLAIAYRDAIIAEATRHKLPTLYYSRAFITSGGLLSYGSDRFEQFRNAAAYVDRILKGEKPGDLPVQNPTKYELTVNLKAAKAIGIDVPATLLARADEVIE